MTAPLGAYSSANTLMTVSQGTPIRPDSRNSTERAARTSLVRPLRIVHVVSSLQVGGMEQFVLRLAAEQQRRGHAASILALQGGPLAEQASRLGVPARVLGGSQRHLRVARGALSLAGLRPHIAHAHNHSSLHYGVLARLVGNPRVVLTYHGRGKADARTPTAREWRNTDAIVAVSEAALPEVPPNYSGRLQVIRNGIQLPQGARSREMTRAELGVGDRLVGVMVARIDGLKGHDTLLRAGALLRRTGLPVTFCIAGDGAQRTDLEKLARDLGLNQEWVRFLGFRSDVPALLAAADFFLLPSVTEGLPLSLLEAMAHRLPVIATPVGGIPEVLENGVQGLLVPVNDPSALAEAITRLTQDASLRAALGDAAYQRVKDDFSFERMAEEYEELYYSLCAPRDPATQ